MNYILSGNHSQLNHNHYDSYTMQQQLNQAKLQNKNINSQILQKQPDLKQQIIEKFHFQKSYDEEKNQPLSNLYLFKDELQKSKTHDNQEHKFKEMSSHLPSLSQIHSTSNTKHQNHKQVFDFQRNHSQALINNNNDQLIKLQNSKLSQNQSEHSQIQDYLNYLYIYDQQFPQHKNQFFKINEVEKKDDFIYQKYQKNNSLRNKYSRLKQKYIKTQDNEKMISKFKENMDYLLYTIKKVNRYLNDLPGYFVRKILLKLNRKLFLKVFLKKDRQSIVNMERINSEIILNQILNEFNLQQEGLESSVSDYNIKSIAKLLQLIILDTNYIIDQITDNIQENQNRKLDSIQQNFIQYTKEMQNIKNDIVVNKKHLVLDFPELDLKKLGIQKVEDYGIQQKIKSLENNNLGYLKKIDKITRSIYQTIDKFSGHIKNNHSHNHQNEQFFFPISEYESQFNK